MQVDTRGGAKTVGVFAISIPRFRERHSYIQEHLARQTEHDWQTVGVDGEELRINSASWPHNPNLRTSEVGCAASHAAACRLVAEHGLDAGLILEDDVVLPKDIDQILAGVLPELGSADVVSLYNRTVLPEKFSTIDSISIGARTLVYPMETRFMRTAAAYLIGVEAARRLADYNFPVRVVADDWSAFFYAGVIDSIRLLHPIAVQLHPFASTLSIDRGSKPGRLFKSLMGQLKLTSQLRVLRRRYIERRREGNVVLVNLPADQARFSRLRRG